MHMEHVPALNFVDSWDGGHAKPEYKRHCSYVDKVLSHRYPHNVTKVSYRDSLPDFTSIRDSMFRRVIKYAVSHATQHLVMDLTNHVRGIEFPELFDSRSDCSLKTLELGNFILRNGVKSVGLRVLTTLRLFSCEFSSSDQDVVDPFSNLPSLKNLALDACYREDCEPGDKVKRFRVSGLQLLTLELVDMVLYDFEVCAPKLKSLTVWEGGLQESMEFSFSTLLSLEHVDVRLCSIKDRKQLVCFFQRFPSITSLTLNDHIIKELRRVPKFLQNQLSPFKRLKNLNITSKDMLNNIPYKVTNYFLNGTSCADPNINFLRDRDISKVGLERWQ
ncbi:hypothetical protein LINGRAHAP2_LOCUS3115 [Linum grandiflorum]